MVITKRGSMRVTPPFNGAHASVLQSNEHVRCFHINEVTHLWRVNSVYYIRARNCTFQVQYKSVKNLIIYGLDIHSIDYCNTRKKKNNPIITDKIHKRVRFSATPSHARFCWKSLYTRAIKNSPYAGTKSYN